MIDALVLAAGAGARFGGGKLMADYAGAPLIEAALAAAFAAPVRRVVVVTGADSRIAAAARRFAEGLGEAARLKLVEAERHAEGLSASLAAGVEAASDAACLLVFLGDMPALPPGVTKALIGCWGHGAVAAAPTWRGRRGHPVLFDARLFPQLRALQGDSGARALLAGLGDRLATVEASSDGVLFDVDRPSDLEGGSPARQAEPDLARPRSGPRP